MFRQKKQPGASAVDRPEVVFSSSILSLPHLYC